MYPADLKYTKDHEWAKVEGNSVTVGITDHAQGGHARDEEVVATASFHEARQLVAEERRVRVVRIGLNDDRAALGRMISGADQRISTLPWPGSRWTTSRDVPEPPAETFRQWLARTHHEGHHA